MRLDLRLHLPLQSHASYYGRTAKVSPQGLTSPAVMYEEHMSTERPRDEGMGTFSRMKAFSALARYGHGGEAMRDGPAHAPFASINYGAAGIAYAIYRLARAHAAPDSMDLAEAWVHNAFALSTHVNAFYDPTIGIEPATVGATSLFHSLSGLHCIQGLVAIARRDAMTANRAIAAFAEHSRGQCESPDLTLGKASILLGCAELVEATPAASAVDLVPVQMSGDRIAKELLDILRSDQFATSTRNVYLGIAHGWAGLLFALVRWTRAMRRRPAAILPAKLDELAALAVAHDKGLCWTVHNNTTWLIPGWCNGTAGYAMLFALAHEVLGHERYSRIAIGAAESAWAIKTPGGSLCCGNAGNGYAFLAAYRLTGSGLWLRRARAAARRAAADRSERQHLDALYKGALGAALLGCELQRPRNAAMPLFEPVR